MLNSVACLRIRVFGLFSLVYGSLCFLKLFVGFGLLRLNGHWYLLFGFD